MADYFTKAAEAELMRSQDTGTVESVFFNWWIGKHGVPESVHSGRGPDFESWLLMGLCKMCQISSTCTAPTYPQGNGQVERRNCTLLGLLKAFTKDVQPDDWDLSLGRVLLAYKVTIHTSTGVSPSKMLTGHKMRVPSAIILPNIDESVNNVPEHRTQTFTAILYQTEETSWLTLPNKRLPRRRLSAYLQTGSPTWNTPQVPSLMVQGPVSGGESVLTYKPPRPQRTAVYSAGNHSSQQMRPYKGHRWVGMKRGLRLTEDRNTIWDFRGVVV
ncbi:RNA directed DNA polymerase (reverse transcriptase) [Echinococcus multilocularis]|uniref:RNA directed DNA polymerase (Reverse transcriptase) n=1 Tax=Echinococcus multilocularis TaxID=6211 RepID=A0A0S4MI17_ECHMU|nr:RNA directed DNA polymerase (reverse transcriptase) [Echinococcus multilocularis]